MTDKTDITNSANQAVLDAHGFEYWFRMAWWNCTEATLLCLDTVPECEYINGEPVVTYWDLMQMAGIEDAEQLLRLVKREFPTDKIDAKTLFSWIEEKKIPIGPKFRDAAQRHGFLTNTQAAVRTTRVGSQSSTDMRGAHWKEKRLHILAAVLQALNDSETSQAIRKANGNIVIDRLSDYLDDNRHRWSFLRDSEIGASRKNIRDTISWALSFSD